MSKRALKKYLHELSKEQLEEQVMDLYQRFREVKTYYDFSFNPREEKLMAEAKAKIEKEYFPPGRRRPKARRSVAQKYFKHFAQLGVDPLLMADLMLYNVETAMRFNWKRPQRSEAFFKSIASSFGKAWFFIHEQALLSHFETRLDAVVAEAEKQEWYNLPYFEELQDQWQAQP